ncbi:MAG: DNA-binding protein [Parcubacteria group bacterium]|nr:DNA-binding protein [Parcubacteria group bacterium]
MRLKPGQNLKEEIEKIAVAEGIEAGCLLSLVGGLKNTRLRMPGAKPENQIVKEWEGPFEIVSGTGTISKEGCHIHVSLSDKEGNVIGGHLKDDCVVRSTVEVVLGVFDDVVFKRTLDNETGFKELEVEKLNS